MTTKSYIVTKDKAQVLSNKTIDADSNVIQNLEVGDLKSSAVSTTIPSTDAVDTKLTTEKAVADALEAKLGKQYTEAEDGYVAKVDSSDHVLKVMNGGTTSVAFADITGSPSDNTNLQNILDTKVDTAGSGLSIDEQTINHSNSVTADSSSSLKAVSYDAQGHITGSTAKSFGAGIEDNANTIGHINSVVAQTTGKLGTITYDAQGHITGFTEKPMVTSWSATVTDSNIPTEKLVKTAIDALQSVAHVEVVETFPTSPVNNTMYYVGTSSPYAIKLYVNDTTYDMGTTEIDLTSYVQKSAIADNLTTDESTKVLSAKQGKILNDSKLNLSGGTMTGDINMQTNLIKGSQITIEATDGTNTVDMVAKPDGTLTWGGNNVCVESTGTITASWNETYVNTTSGFILIAIKIAPNLYAICIIFKLASGISGGTEYRITTTGDFKIDGKYPNQYWQLACNYASKTVPIGAAVNYNGNMYINSTMDLTSGSTIRMSGIIQTRDS